MSFQTFPRIKIGRQGEEGGAEEGGAPPEDPQPPTQATEATTGGSGGRPIDPSLKPGYKEQQTFYVPIIVLTVIFGALFIVGPIAVRKGPNSGIAKCSIMITAFCMWIFWVTIYISQMNPLLGPRLHNTSVAWLGYTWGKDAKTLSGRR